MEVNNKKKDAFLPLVIAMALMAGILIGLNIRNRTAGAGSNRGLLLFSKPGKVEQTLELIKTTYVDSVSAQRLEEDAIAGMLKNLDPHSQYFPAADFAAVNEPIEGNFSGIGVSFNMMNDTIMIINTIAKGPSEKAGIMAGDRIVRVNDTLVAGVKMPSNAIEKMLKGKTGTAVNVAIYRRSTGEHLSFDITRGRIPMPSVNVAYMIAPDVGYIKVNIFSKTTLREFTDAANQLKAEGMKKVIVDLRGNPGGIIDAAIGMCRLLLPAGKLIVYTEGAGRGRADYYSGGSHPEYSTMQLALLIDESSASASEIVAGAIQDNDRGTIIGRRSFGKGLVQTQHPLPDGSAVRITVARYYTPAGRCIQKPYAHNSKDEYFNELRERYSNGEMTRADSVHFNDSLRYVTPAGKVVYGGGGIMPDIFIPIDTTVYSSYYGKVMRRRLTLGFAFEYADRNRKELAALPDHTALVTHLRQKNILSEFIAYANRQGVVKNDADLKVSGTLIENILMAYIGRNILNNQGYYTILNRTDTMVQKGIDVLRN